MSGEGYALSSASCWRFNFISHYRMETETGVEKEKEMILLQTFKSVFPGTLGLSITAS